VVHCKLEPLSVYASSGVVGAGAAHGDRTGIVSFELVLHMPLTESMKPSSYGSKKPNFDIEEEDEEDEEDEEEEDEEDDE